MTGLADGFKESLLSLGITSDSIKESFDLFVEGLKIGFDARHGLGAQLSPICPKRDSSTR